MYNGAVSEDRPFYADGEICPTDFGESGEAAIERVRHRYDLTWDHVLDIISELGPVMGNSADRDGELRRSRELMQRVATALAWLICYDGDVRMAARCMAFSLGFKDISGCKDGTATSLAKACSSRKHRVIKATANKCILSCDKALNIAGYNKMPPLPGQRTEEAREAMKKARERQLIDRNGHQPQPTDGQMP